jgi:polysaccharide biosynthesis/export protein
MAALVACVAGCAGSSPEFSLTAAEKSSSQVIGKAGADDGTRTNLKKIADRFATSTSPGSQVYKIGPQDVIEIAVFKVAELGRTIQVADNGQVNVPLIGDVVAAGLTARELEVNLTKQWGDKYLRNPQVSVFIKEYNSQRVTVEGAVKRPGVFPLKGELSLLQAIASAAGLEETADSEVLVFRLVGEQRQAARFSLTEIRNGTVKDPQLQSKDVVVVGSSAAKELLNNFGKIVPIARLFTVF